MKETTKKTVKEDTAAWEKNKALVEELKKSDKANIDDVQKCEFVDAYKSGIIDPTKVVRSALESAASAASLLVISEGVVVEAASEGDKGDKMPAMGGGMPGMGGF